MELTPLNAFTANAPVQFNALQMFLAPYVANITLLWAIAWTIVAVIMCAKVFLAIQQHKHKIDS